MKRKLTEAEAIEHSSDVEEEEEEEEEDEDDDEEEEWKEGEDEEEEEEEEKEEEDEDDDEEEEEEAAADEDAPCEGRAAVSRFGAGEEPASQPPLVPLKILRPTLSPVVNPHREQFYSRNLTYTRITTNCCIYGLEYNVAVGHWLREFYTKKIYDVVNDPKLNVSNQLRDQICALVLERTAMDGCEVTAMIPQLKSSDQQHESNFFLDENPAYTRERVLLPGGRVYEPIRNGHPDKKKACLKVENGNAGLKITFSKVTLTILGGGRAVSDGVTEIQVPPGIESIESALMPEMWLRKDVLRFRPKNEPDKLLLAQLEFMGNQKNVSLRIEILRIRSNGRVRSGRANGATNTLSMYGCGSNGIWKEDTSKSEAEKLMGEFSIECKRMPSDGDRFSEAVKLLARDGTKLTHLKREIRKETKKPEVTDQELHDKLARVCEATSPNDLTGEEHYKFMKSVYDDTFTPTNRVIAFQDGWCYDPSKRTIRRILPGDRVTKCIKRDYPEPNEEGRKIIDDFLIELFPNESVREYVLDWLAIKLGFKQVRPGLMALMGKSGAGKGILCRVIDDALGGLEAYSYAASKELLTKPKSNGGEGPTEARMQFEDKVIFLAQEVTTLDEDTLKEWTGGDKMNGRVCNGHHAQFTPTHGMMITFQSDKTLHLKVDAGIENRFVAIETPNEYQSFNTKAEADEQERIWRTDGSTAEDGAESTKNKNTMYPEKGDAIMENSDQLLHMLIERHQKNQFSDQPEQVREMTTRFLAEADSCQPCQVFMKENYDRCACVQNNRLDDTTKDLRNPHNGTQCDHFVSCSEDIIQKMKEKVIKGGATLYKKLKGRGRDDDSIRMHIRQCSLGGLRLHIQPEHKGKRNMVRGIVNKPTPSESALLCFMQFGGAAVGHPVPGHDAASSAFRSGYPN